MFIFCWISFFAFLFYLFLTYILLLDCYKTCTNYVDRSNSWYFFSLLIHIFSIYKNRFKKLQHKSKNTEIHELYMLVLGN